MTIRDVEKKVGITSANIRFYEKEGLLNPKRNQDNNYREYTEEHVELLWKIKVLRMLGVSVQDIRLLIHSEAELSDVIERRREELRREEEKLKEIDKLCRYILEERMNFETMDRTRLEKELITLSDRLEYVICGDVTKEILSKKKMNNIIAGMLLWAFLSNACITFFVADFMLGGEAGLMKMLWPVIITCIVSTFAVAWTARPGILMVFFQMVSLVWIPLLLFAVKLLTGSDSAVFLRDGGILIFLILAVAAIFLRALSSGKTFKKLWKTDLVMLGYSAVAAAVLTYIIGMHYLFAFMLVAIFVLYMSAVWVDANRGEGTINKYYVITTVTGMLNFVIKMMNYQNIGMEKGYGRQELWKGTE